jgi:hypothetical protein
MRMLLVPSAFQHQRVKPEYAVPGKSHIATLSCLRRQRPILSIKLRGALQTASSIGLIERIAALRLQ